MIMITLPVLFHQGRIAMFTLHSTLYAFILFYKNMNSPNIPLNNKRDKTNCYRIETDFQLK